MGAFHRWLVLLFWMALLSISSLAGLDNDEVGNDDEYILKSEVAREASRDENATTNKNNNQTNATTMVQEAKQSDADNAIGVFSAEKLGESPPHTPDSEDDRKEDDDDGDDEEEEEEEEDEKSNTFISSYRKETKVKLSQVLSSPHPPPSLPWNNTTTNSTLLKKTRSALGSFVKQHRFKVLVAVVLYANRKLIKRLVSKLARALDLEKMTQTQRTLFVMDVLKVVLLLFALKELMAAAMFSSVDYTTNDTDSSNKKTAVLLLLLLFLTIVGGRGGGRGSSGLEFLLNPSTVAVLLPLLLGSSGKSSIYVPPVEQHYTFEVLNNRYAKDGLAWQKAMGQAVKSTSGSGSGSTTLPSQKGHAASNLETLPSYSALTFKLHQNPWQRRQQQLKQQKIQQQPFTGTTILMDMTNLDSYVSNMNILRDKISFLLSEVNKQQQRQQSSSSTGNTTTIPFGTNNNTTNNDTIEVAILLQSPGGSASDYALAAQQILRLRNHPGITVTVLVDKVAASGGYMIACCSSPGRLFAAPFAVLGSIGVVGQQINVQKVLEGWGVQPLVFKGGHAKAPVGFLGDVTDEGLAKVQDMVDAVHRAFQRHVVEARPVLAKYIRQVATGETWLGYDALGVGLIDGITTSDDYVSQRISEGALVLKLLRINKQPPSLFRQTTEVAVGSAYSSSFLGNLVSYASRLLVHAITWINRAKSAVHMTA